MPIHDWTRVDAGIFHHFHQRWKAALCDVFNSGGLPAGYFALAEQVIRGPTLDVLTLKVPQTADPPGLPSGVAVATAPPRARYVLRAESDVYVRKANRVTVRHKSGQVVAVIEIVSSGNKNSRNPFRAFVQKAVELIEQGVNLLIVDLFPPSDRDPQGIHKAIWDEIGDEPFTQPPDKRLTVAAYEAGPVKVAYVEPVAVGDPLPDLPLFLEPEVYVPAPLEATYRTTWSVFPTALKGLLEPPAS